MKQRTKYALGRVVLYKTLRSLQQHTARSIFVETDGCSNTAFRLHESLGFQVIREVQGYGKDYNDPSAWGVETISTLQLAGKKE